MDGQFLSVKNMHRNAVPFWRACYTVEMDISGLRWGAPFMGTLICMYSDMEGYIMQAPT